MPQQFHLSEDDIRATVRRASELAHQASAEPTEQDLEVYLKAAEEAGLPRSAVLQALQERLIVPLTPYQVGDSVFAPSVDGRHYAATVVRCEAPLATVRFVGGAEHAVALADLRPLGLVPGLKVEAKEMGIWCSGTVESFDEKKQQVRVNSAWLTRNKFSVQDVRLPVVRVKMAPTVRQQLLRFGLAIGGVGFLLGWLVGHFS